MRKHTPKPPPGSPRTRRSVLPNPKPSRHRPAPARAMAAMHRAAGDNGAARSALLSRYQPRPVTQPTDDHVVALMNALFADEMGCH